MERKNGNIVNLGIVDIPKWVSKGQLSNIFLIMDNLDDDNNAKQNRASLPMKTDDLFSIHVLRGSIKLIINLVEVEIKENEMLTIMPDCVFEMISSSDDLKYFCFTLNLELHDKMQGNMGIQTTMTNKHARFYNVSLDKEVMDNILSTYKLIKNELVGPDYPTKRQVVQRYCEIIALKDYSHYSQNIQMGESVKSRQEEIFHNFLTLLEHNYKREHSISFYADKMCLTAKYLSTVIRMSSGKPGLQWIEEYLIFEAKGLIRQGRLSIKQVSDELNFPTQSMFGRFFKKMTGYSPKQYKQL